MYEIKVTFPDGKEQIYDNVPAEVTQEQFMGRLSTDHPGIIPTDIVRTKKQTETPIETEGETGILPEV